MHSLINICSRTHMRTGYTGLVSNGMVELELEGHMFGEGQETSSWTIN